MNTGNYYSDISIFASSLNNVDSILNKLYTFSDTWGKYMSQEEKNIILNFILPEFEDNDYSVKIYSVLSE